MPSEISKEMIEAFIIASESADRRLCGFHNLGRHFILDGTKEVWFTASDDYEVGHAAMMEQLKRLKVEQALEAALSVSIAIGEGSRVEGLEVLRQKAAAIKAEFEMVHTEPFDCSTTNGALHYGRWQGMEMAADLLAAAPRPPAPPERRDAQAEERIAEKLILMSARGDIAPMSSGDALAIAAALSPPSDGELVRMREVVTGYRLLPKEPTGAMLEAMASNLADEFGPDFVLANKDFARAVYAEAWATGTKPLNPSDSRETAKSLYEAFQYKTKHGNRADDAFVAIVSSALADTNSRTLTAVQAALSRYDEALKNREHGGVAANRCIDDLRAVLSAKEGQ